MTTLDNIKASLQTLPNGLVRVEHLGSGLTGLWHRDGRPHSGSLTHSVNADTFTRMVLAHG